MFESSVTNWIFVGIYFPFWSMFLIRFCVKISNLFSSLIPQIVLLLRLVPLLPFNMLNYLLSVTPVPLGEYMLASWVGMMV